MNLPSIASIVRSDSLGVEDGLRQRKPSRLIRSWILEVGLGGAHTSHSPEALVIITHRLRPVRRHHIIILSRLPLNSCRNDIVVRSIAGVMPIINQSAPHRTRFPPVIYASLAFDANVRVVVETYSPMLDSEEVQVRLQEFLHLCCLYSMSSYRMRLLRRYS